MVIVLNICEDSVQYYMYFCVSGRVKLFKSPGRSAVTHRYETWTTWCWCLCSYANIWGQSVRIIFCVEQYMDLDVRCLKKAVKLNQSPICVEQYNLMCYPCGHGPLARLTHCGLVTPLWWHKSGLKLVQVMACFLTAPSHYLKQCWLEIIDIYYRAISLKIHKIYCQKLSFKIILEMYMHQPGGNELSQSGLVLSQAPSRYLNPC